MNFFEAQERARRRTGLLVLLFGIAVVTIVLVVYVAVHVGTRPSRGGLDPVLLIQVALGVGFIIGVGAIYRTASLSRGGPAVAELLGGRRVAPDTTDPDERKFLNVVEEMSIASGTPVPTIYVLDAEDGINAFAAGYSSHDAAIAVTRGALIRLTRDELQGVVAHEFSHIFNGDMRLNIHLIGLLYGILLLAVIGRGILRARPRGRRSGKGGAGWILLLGFTLFLVGYIGVFFGQLIKAAVSRQREYLADAAAVEFTRNPDGLADALKKIGAAPNGSRIRNVHAEELSHLFFAEGVRGALSSFMATHPPLDERIKRLDPAWTGEIEMIEPQDQTVFSSVLDEGWSEEDGPVAAAAPTLSVGDPDAVIDTVGGPGPESLAYASALLQRLPADLFDTAHTVRGAMALVFALALVETPDEEVRGEWDAIRKFGSEDLVSRVRELVGELRNQGREARLPLLDLALPAMSTLSPAEAAAFLKAFEDTVIADGRLRLFEYTMVHTLGRHLDRTRARSPGATTIGSFAPIRRETAALLSALAWTGSEWRADRALAALTAGWRRLPSDAGLIDLMDQASVSIDMIDRSLRTFEQATPAVRRRLLEACAEVVTHDQTIAPVEMELVRAVAEALDCPMPPLVT